MEIFMLLISLLFSWICYKTAEDKNRNKIAWAISGFIFGIFPLAILIMLDEIE